MDKNTVIGFLLIILIFVGFSVFETGRVRKNAELQAQADSIALAMNPVREMPDVAEEEELRNGGVVPAYKDSAIQKAYGAEARIVAIGSWR